LLLEASFASLRNSKNALKVSSAMDVAPTSMASSETLSASRINSSQVTAAKRAENVSSMRCALMDFSVRANPTHAFLRMKRRQHKI
jgi:hypothetical protein